MTVSYELQTAVACESRNTKASYCRKKLQKEHRNNFELLVVGSPLVTVSGSEMSYNKIVQKLTNKAVAVY